MDLQTDPISSLRPHTRTLFSRTRRKTREVLVGTVGVGGANPLRLQSMTTTNTLDTNATVEQTLRMVAAGCEIVRITTPKVEDARNLGKIKEALLKRGCAAPLVADVHFKPEAAMEAAEWAEKVRINPGNFVDGKRFAVREYSDAQYDAEMDRIEERFTPLVEKLKRLGRALRIGANHGSLSDRILNRYGDTPQGMVESALEYLRICRKLDYHAVILSMKASNPKVMIAAYRMLAARMDEEEMDYPFHLGVTEAGDGEDGRIKSAVGIGSLLEDGIGDTIRVSLTEDPEKEIPVCRALAAPYAQPPLATQTANPDSSFAKTLYAYSRRISDSVRIGPFRIGGAHPFRTVTQWDIPAPEAGPRILKELEHHLASATGQEPEILEWRVRSEEDLDCLRSIRAELTGETSRLAHIVRFENSESPVPWDEVLDACEAPLWDDQTEGTALLTAAAQIGKPVWIEGKERALVLKRLDACREAGVPAIAALCAPSEGLLHAYRSLTAALNSTRMQTPIHLRMPAMPDPESHILRASTTAGALLCDGIGDSLQVLGPREESLRLSYGILQAAGVRITKTEYVSCPSCGRTLFDLQETTERIKAKTGHLKGVKIAIMGCIVNGPGEMADADFGYVGGAPDRINLYVNKTCVRKGIPTAEADAALIGLIKEHGKWKDAARPGTPAAA